MVNKNKISVGYITTPHPHGSMHIKTLDVIDEVDQIYLCGLENEDLESMASLSSKVVSKTTDLSEILSNKDIDALLVCVRPDICPGVLDAALDAGKGALFEKPGALTSKDLKPIAKKANELGITMGTMFQNRFGPSMQDIIRIVNGGALGNLMTVEARMVTSQVRYRDPEMWIFKKDMAGTGILGWLGCHYIDLLCHLIDSKIKTVTAIVGNRNPEKIEVEDTAGLVVKFENGVLGTINCGYHLPSSSAGYSSAAYDTFIGIRGADGYVRLEPSEGEGYSLMSISPDWESGGLRQIDFNNMPHSEAYGDVGGRNFVSDFLTAAIEKRPAKVTIDDAVHVLEVIDAAIESSSTGRTIDL